MIHDVQFPSDPVSWFLLEIKAINKYFILMRFSILQGFRGTVKIIQLRLTLAIRKIGFKNIDKLYCNDEQISRK